MQKKIGIILLIAGILSLLLFLADNLKSLPMTKEGINYVERNKQGKETDKKIYKYGSEMPKNHILSESTNRNIRRQNYNENWPRQKFSWRS
mgnify:CR=1 FL=1